LQTKHQIQQLLALTGSSPNKRLGQNFLIDLNLMRLLIDTAQILDNDIVIEVGCGTGSLTEAISEKCGLCVTVEFDKRLAAIAQKQFAEALNIKLLNCDILANKHTINKLVMDRVKTAREKYTGRVLLVANLPYQVACPVMLNLIAGDVVVDAMYVTVQKEVAQRMVAKAASKGYGPLSIFLAVSGDVKIERILKPSVFWPEPKVDSAMVSFIYNSEKAGQISDFELLSDVVNLFMGHRRKMLKACTKFAAGRLAEISNWQEIFEKCSIDQGKRGDHIEPKDYVGLANACYLQLFGK
jgi:16S rRNA (adenine1518-N6/adenine1519-N6)-dimethyltransferase